MDLKVLGKRRGFGIGSGIAVVIGIISLSVINGMWVNLQNQANASAGQTAFNSSLTMTIIPYVVPVGALGLLVMAAGDYLPR